METTAPIIPPAPFRRWTFPETGPAPDQLLSRLPAAVAWAWFFRQCRRSCADTHTT